jgi:hypothetical protein
LVTEADAAAAGMGENPNDPSGQETEQEKKLATPTKNAVAKKKKIIPKKKVVDKGNNSAK